jgi:hypothetical protein
MSLLPTAACITAEMITYMHPQFNCAFLKVGSAETRDNLLTHLYPGGILNAIGNLITFRVPTEKLHIADATAQTVVLHTPSLRGKSARERRAQMQRWLARCDVTFLQGFNTVDLHITGLQSEYTSVVMSSFDAANDLHDRIEAAANKRLVLPDNIKLFTLVPAVQDSRRVLVDTYQWAIVVCSVPRALPAVFDKLPAGILRAALGTGA